MTHTLFSLLALQGLLFAAIVAFAAGVWIVGMERKVPRDRAVSLFISASALWVFAYVLWQTSEDPGQAQFWLRSLYLIASFIAPAFALFAVTVFRERLPSSAWILGLFLPNAAIGWSLFYTGSVVGRSLVVPTPASGSGILILALHFAAFSLGGLILLYLSIRRGRLVHPGSPTLLLAGGIATMVPIFLFLFFYVIVFGSTVPLAVPFSVLIGELLVGIAVFRSRSRGDVSVFGIEVLVFVVLFMLASDTVASAADQSELAVRLSILVLLVMFGAMMTRAHAKEMKRLQNIESMHDVLVRMNGKLLEADRVKTKFVSFASHQLRAPIGGIRGYLDMMRKGDFGKLTKKQGHVIDMNLEALERLTSTIKTFLDITKLEFGKFELFRTDVRIDELVRKVAEEMRPAVERKNLAFEIDVPHDLPTLHADAGKLHHVLANLIDNALKYTEKGKITVMASRQGEEVAVRVQDTGVGLTRKDRERIFHVFERGISAVKLESSGAGLGLHIVKNIVEAHGGRILVESGGRQKGSSFGFAIPIGQ